MPRHSAINELVQNFNSRTLLLLTNSDNLEVVLLGPVEQPGSKSVDSAGIGLVHERNVAVATSTSLLELLLALLSRLAVPVTRVNIVGDDLVPELGHGRKNVAAGGEVRRTHVSGLLANDVNHGLLKLLHLLLELVGAQATEVLGVGPGVTGDLVAVLVSLLDGGSVVVNTAVELAGPEECAFGAGLVEGVDELVGVLAWAIIVSEGENAGLGALADDLASGLTVEDLDGVLDGGGGDVADDQEGAESGGDEGLHFGTDIYSEVSRNKEWMDCQEENVWCQGDFIYLDLNIKSWHRPNLDVTKAIGRSSETEPSFQAKVAYPCRLWSLAH